MVLKVMTGLMPELDLPKMLAGMTGSSGIPMIGWILHFAISIVVYGFAVAALDANLPGFRPVGHRVVFGVIG